MIVYTKNDLITLKIMGVEFDVAPLTRHHKAEITSCVTKAGGASIEDAMESTALLMKYTIKGLRGVKLINGKDYTLELKDGVLTDDCVSDLLNLATSEKLTAALNNFLKGIPAKLIDHATGEALEGVEFVEGGNTQKK